MINFRFDESSALFSSVLLALFHFAIQSNIDRKGGSFGAAYILISGISKSEKFSGLFGQRYCWLDFIHLIFAWEGMRKGFGFDFEVGKCRDGINVELWEFVQCFWCDTSRNLIKTREISTFSQS